MDSFYTKDDTEQRDQIRKVNMAVWEALGSSGQFGGYTGGGRMSPFICALYPGVVQTPYQVVRPWRGVTCSLRASTLIIRTIACRLLLAGTV